MSTPKTIAAEYTRALAAEKALSDRITALEKPVPVPPPAPPPPTGKTVQAPNVSVLMSAYGDDSVSEIVVANGVQHISGSADQNADSLWIDKRFAGRTRPIIVRPATPGGVTFDAGGGYLGGISFSGEGGKLSTWQDFHFANGVTGSTGVIVFGGYPGMNAPHDLALKRITVDASCHRVNDGATDHAVYFSYALDTWGNILIEDLTVDASGPLGLATAIHRDHGGPADAPLVAAHGVTVRNLTFLGNKSFAAQQAILLWFPPARDWLFDGATIKNAGGFGIRYEATPASNIVFKDIVSDAPFYSSQAKGTPLAVPGVTLQNCNQAWAA